MTTGEAALAPTWPEPISGLYDWFEAHRSTDRIIPGELPGLWHVFGYDDIAKIFGDHSKFSSDFSALLPPNPDMDWFATGNFLMMDPPVHRRLRSLVSKAFTPKYVASLEPRVREIAAGLLEKVAGQSRIDVVADLAYPLPVVIIAELIGVPSDDLDLFRGWAEAFVKNNGEEGAMPTPEQIEAFRPTGRAMNAYLLEHVAKCRANPGDDLISGLVVTEDDGRRLSDEEIVSFVALLLMAGHVTTTALLGNTIMCLEENPGVAERLRADPSLIPAAIEEVLRLRPTLVRQMRLTKEEVEVGGRTVPAGQMLCVWAASANRDEQHFAEPDRFDLDRKPNRHLAFGSGIHFCLGAPLARLEGRVALELMLQRYARMSVPAGEPIEFHNPQVVLGAKKLPLDVEPA
ncbi:cytochrome P450 [Amycolatopsis sp. PS_44_ISF1]|uniref:cytochrome P450 n=1 Tax=Amycolatopsis sp. PS_44_ISF1 TaxID=2974917 RepID=UPI0028DFF39D|nr:cytochrome P450 [Amycolatopsis sp. PS_44_ISF1]MDT8912320.1 cytochrome P450 [Amycolatopsis sp. PS_44_ISF1]